MDAGTLDLGAVAFGRRVVDRQQIAFGPGQLGEEQNQQSLGELTGLASQGLEEGDRTREPL